MLQGYFKNRPDTDCVRYAYIIKKVILNRWNKALIIYMVCIKAGYCFRPEPIGLYFADLWYYSEELYDSTFVRMR